MIPEAIHEPMSDVVVVLGMHRSGTSAITGALTKLGGAAPSHAMAPDLENAQGYFESVPLMHFHDDLLASAGSSWHDWRKFNPAWYRSPVVESYRHRAREIFEAEFANSSLPILKDPRICRFLPFWIDVFKEMDAIPRIVMPIRSPLDVALSLRRAQGISLTRGLLLWLRHVLDAEADTRCIPRSIFTWDQFLSDWRRISDKISVDTGLSWPRLSDRATHDVEQFLIPKLVHDKTDYAALIAHSDIHEWMIGAYEALLELARNPASNSASERLDEIRGLFEQSSTMFGRALVDYEIGLEDLRSRAETSRIESDRLRAEQGALETGYTSVTAARDRLSDELQVRHRELAESAALFAERTTRLEQSEARLVEAHREKEQLMNWLAERTAQLEQADAFLAEANREKIAFSNELATRAAELAASLAERGALVAQLQAREQALAEAAACHADLGLRLEQSENALARANQEKSELSNDLATRTMQFTAVLEETERLSKAVASKEASEIASSLATSVNEALAVELSEVRSTLAEALRKNEDLAQTLSRLGENESEVVAAVEARRLDLETRLHSTSGENKVLAAALDRMSLESRGREKAAADRVAMLEAAHAGTLAEMQNRFEIQIHALRSQLVDTDAALAKSVATARSRAFLGKILPSLGGLRGLERQLIRTGLFDVEWYTSEYPDVATSGVSPTRHFLEDGYLRGYRPNPFFDTRWYLGRYEDVRRSGMNPLLHYAVHGYREGRDPGPDFQTNFYLMTYPDVRADAMNPLAHYLRHGRAEGRMPTRPQETL